MSIRTSQSHPLVINEVAAPGCSGLIGLTFCPGKKDCHSTTGIWERDLSADLTVIREWGAVRLVTLLEDHELDMLSVRQLPEAAQEHSLLWHHLPIRDLSIPGSLFQSRWHESRPVLLNTLQNGDRLVIHCRGGLGRTGLLAAVLLVELGMDSWEAVRLVRAARPGAIETVQQEAYIHGYRHVHLR